MTGEEIRAARDTLGLTQRQFAQLLGVTANTVARWERGEVRALHDTLLRARIEQLLKEHHAPTD